MGLILEELSTQKLRGGIVTPPFIRYQSFPKEHREKAFSMMNKLGFKPNKLYNKFKFFHYEKPI